MIYFAFINNKRLFQVCFSAFECHVCSVTSDKSFAQYQEAKHSNSHTNSRSVSVPLPSPSMWTNEWVSCPIIARCHANANCYVLCLFFCPSDAATFIHFVLEPHHPVLRLDRVHASSSLSSVLLIAACKKFPPVISPPQGRLTLLVMDRRRRRGNGSGNCFLNHTIGQKWEKYGLSENSRLFHGETKCVLWCSAYF